VRREALDNGLVQVRGVLDEHILWLDREGDVVSERHVGCWRTDEAESLRGKGARSAGDQLGSASTFCTFEDDVPSGARDTIIGTDNRRSSRTPQYRFYFAPVLIGVRRKSAASTAFPWSRMNISVMT
jgi:hypothetical protein